MRPQEFFAGIHTTQQIKDEYRRLAKLHHPDTGGDTATMQAINRDYALAMANAIRAEKPGWSEEKYASAATVAEAIREAIEKIITLPHVEIEICGLWVWVAGDTRPVKDALKSAGYRWSPNKSKWYFAGIPAGGHGNWTMSEIRERYGSEMVERDERSQARIYA